MLVRPCNDLLIIRRLPDPDPVTDWGFALPPGDEHADTPLRGLVLAAGSGHRPKAGPAALAVVSILQECISELRHGISHRLYADLIEEAERVLAESHGVPDRAPMSVQVGDTVIFSKFGFQEFRISGENLIVTQEASILGIIEV